MEFYRDPETGIRVFGKASRQLQARRLQTRPAAQEPEQPKALGTIVKTAIINAITEAHPAICRRLVQEAVCLGIERATEDTMRERRARR